MDKQHQATFIALFKLFGFSKEVSEAIGWQLADINNATQDNLIALLTFELEKRQNLVGEPNQK